MSKEETKKELKKILLSMVKNMRTKNWKKKLAKF